MGDDASVALQGTTRYRERQPHIAIPVEALRLIAEPTLTCLFEISAIGRCTAAARRDELAFQSSAFANCALLDTRRQPSTIG